MMTLWVQSYLFTLHWVLNETDAAQDLGVALNNLTMVPGEAVLTEARGEKLPFSRIRRGGGGGITTGTMYPFIHCIIFIQFSD